ncbi:MAG TPA: hypothetical protein VGX76_22600, partial [Pirellulales bacterium]|nr:hypothetical protein [Pirellulales bacterium]
GIYTRDYFRWGGGGGQIPPVCKDLIIATVAVFLVQIFITRPPTPQELRAIVEQYRQPLAAKKRPEKKPRGEQETAPPHGTEGPAADSTAATSAKKEPLGGSAASGGKVGPGQKAPPGKMRPVPEEGNEEESGEDDMAFARELLPSVSVVQEWFELDANKVVRQGQVWRLNKEQHPTLA